MADAARCAVAPGAGRRFAVSGSARPRVHKTFKPLSPLIDHGVGMTETPIIPKGGLSPLENENPSVPMIEMPDTPLQHRTATQCPGTEAGGSEQLEGSQRKVERGAAFTSPREYGQLVRGPR